MRIQARHGRACPGPSTSLAVVPRKGVDPRGKPEDDGGWGCAFRTPSMAGLVRPSTSSGRRAQERRGHPGPARGCRRGWVIARFKRVMAGLVPAIHVLAVVPRKGVDPRAKPEDDGGWGCAFKRVMAGLVPAITSLAVRPRKGVDPRGKPEDDGGVGMRIQARHGRACPGHPRLLRSRSGKAWILGPTPKMTLATTAACR